MGVMTPAPFPSRGWSEDQRRPDAWIEFVSSKSSKKRQRYCIKSGQWVSESPTAVAVARKDSHSGSWWVWWRRAHACPSVFPPPPCRVTCCSTWAWAIICSPWILSSFLSARKVRGPVTRWRWRTLTLTVWKWGCLKAPESPKSRCSAVLFTSTEEAGPWRAQVCPGRLGGPWGRDRPGEASACDGAWLSYWMRRGGRWTCCSRTVPVTPLVPRKLLVVSPFHTQSVLVRTMNYVVTPYIKAVTYLFACLCVN